MSAWAIVVAAGKGERAALGRNKVFAMLGGQSVLRRCLCAVRNSGVFDGVVAVISRQDADLFSAQGLDALVDRTADGGETRQQSVYNGLKALPEDVDIVAIHDAARPFAAKALFETAVASARRHGSGVISTPVSDTIKRIDPESGIVSTVDRETLRAVQTPQAFSFDKLLQAHEKAAAEGFFATDDAALFERYWGNVCLVTAPDAERNRKLTTKADFQEEKPVMQCVRVGTGYDAHRLKEGRKLVLGGVEIPHDRGLDGHSDADVAVHALMDAMLGALALGDIGKHFPDSDPAYRGISSTKLLREVTRIVCAAGYQVGNADVTIVAQRPKLSPYMKAMRHALAEAMDVDVSCVSIKATTTEKMGFEGEETGISAQAVVLLQHIREEEQ
ncbi:MAG: 2-C-methyl-D-erythritol 2,4-cyclodiphosphate synthase [Eubacteriales bacterium]|nr:2-C-methyl-D-erythritol 2,4-cyclodiphosphate synthase [Eubacteriales bacterium]